MAVNSVMFYVLLRQRSFVSSRPRVSVSASQRIFSHLAQDQATLQRTPLKIPVERVLTTIPLQSRFSGNSYFKENAKCHDTSSLHRQVVRTSDFKPSGRYFSTRTFLQSSARPHFSEDYDEWYSHGKVGLRTRTSSEGDHPVNHYFYDHHDDAGPGRIPGCFLLEELKREEQQLQLFQNEQHDMDDIFFEFDLPEKAVAGKDTLDFYEILEDETCSDDE